MDCRKSCFEWMRNNFIETSDESRIDGEYTIHIEMIHESGHIRNFVVCAINDVRIHLTMTFSLQSSLFVAMCLCVYCFLSGFWLIDFITNLWSFYWIRKYNCFGHYSQLIGFLSILFSQGISKVRINTKSDKQKWHRTGRCASQWVGGQRDLSESSHHGFRKWNQASE